MASKREIYAAADGLVAANKPVSVRRVRDALSGPPRGSYGTVGPMVADWKKDRNWRAKPLPAQLPVPVQAGLNAFASGLWDAALAAARAEVAHLRLEVECERQALTEVRADIGAAADMLEGRVRELEREAVRLGALHRAEVAALRLRLPEAEQGRASQASSVSGRQRGAAAGEARRFWDEVMREAATILRRAGGELDAETILLRLSEATREQAKAHDRLTPGVLAEKMGVRAASGRYFRRTGPGVFALLAEKDRASASARDAASGGLSEGRAVLRGAAALARLKAAAAGPWGGEAARPLDGPTSDGAPSDGGGGDAGS